MRTSAWRAPCAVKDVRRGVRLRGFRSRRLAGMLPTRRMAAQGLNGGAMTRLALPVLGLVLGVTPAVADLLIVLNKSDHQAALVDPATHKVITKLATGQGPHEVAVTPDGRWAFVANYGVSGVFGNGERRNEPGNTLTVLDLKSRKVARTIKLEGFSKPHGIQASKDGSRIWVTCEATKAVIEVDTKKGEILNKWETGQDISHMVVATPDERK